jgi:TonB family protein
MVTMRTLLIVLLLLTSAAAACPQEQEQAVLVSIGNGVIAPPRTAPIAYETLALPSNTAAAWAMLLAANGLHGDDLRPWYLYAHYKTFDPYGKSKGEGSLEYIWAGRDQWRVTYIEGTTVWTRWKTEHGLYAPHGQTASPGYPERMITGAIQDPLHQAGAPVQTPAYFADEKLSSVTLSCFRSTPLVTPDTLNHSGNAPVLPRFCSVQGRPIARLAQGDYSMFLNRIVSFDHHFVAEQINLLDGKDPVLDIEIEQLRSPSASELSTLVPPSNAEPIRDTSVILPISQTRLRLRSKPAASYPSAMKRLGIQGTVRLAVLVGTDGRVTVTGVLHSPDPMLTEAGEENVRRWTYSPYLSDGRPAPVHTVVAVRYTLGR